MLKLQTARKLGNVTLTTTPDNLIDKAKEQSELAINLMWMVSQRIRENSPWAQTDNTTDIWSELCPTSFAHNELKNKTLGIIGFNSAVQNIAERANQEFDMGVMIYDPYVITNKVLTSYNTETTKSIDDLLAKSDYVLLNDDHQTADNSTISNNDHYLIDARRLNLMKPSACLISIACDAVVDPHALMHALWFETISGAGLVINNNETSIQLYNQVNSQLEFSNYGNVVLLPRPQPEKNNTPAAMFFLVTKISTIFLSVTHITRKLSGTRNLSSFR